MVIPYDAELVSSGVTPQAQLSTITAVERTFCVADWLIGQCVIGAQEWCMSGFMSQSDSCRFRRATNADGAEIWQLISTALAEYRIVACGATTDRDLLDIEGSYWNAGGAFHVLVDDTTIVGTVALHRDSDTVCELCRMYLAAKYRGRGLGRLLFDKALAEAKQLGFEEIRLETAAVLTEAIALYKAAGFALVEGKPTGKNCNLVMSKRIA
jgi:putative acetyltransferase